MRHQTRTLRTELARLAHETHGVVTRRQLLEAGIDPSAVARARRSGLLLAVHPGVYRVGHRAPNIEADYVAAVLACGDGAALSGRAAGHLLGLLRSAPARPEVTAPRERRVRGVSVRRARRGLKGEVAVWRGIPVTTPARTLVDLAGDLPVSVVARAYHEAGIRHETGPDEVEAALARRATSPGAATLRRILYGDERVTLSALEARFLDRLAAEALPLPVTNVRDGARHLDCRWPERRLTVEVDGFRYHRSRHAWEQDRRREREAHARGDDFRRFTYGDVFEDSALMLTELRDLLTDKHPG